MTGNDLREAKESLSMGIPMKTRQGLGMRNGFWMTHVFMSLIVAQVRKSVDSPPGMLTKRSSSHGTCFPIKSSTFA